MDSNSIDCTTFKLFEKDSITQIAAQVSYNADTETAKLDPTSNLRRGVAVEDVEGIMTGRITDPLVSQVAFGVPPSCLLDRSQDTSVLDEEVLDALADETAGAILRDSTRLPEREKEIVLGIVRQFGSQIDGA